MLKSYQATIKMITKENAKLLVESTNIIHESEKTISEMTEKVKKLHDEETKFMTEFRCYFDGNNENVNKVITRLGSTLQAEKKAISHVRSEIKLDNTKLKALVVSK